eukprot:691620-Amphidinium_carterae.1
MENSSLLRGPGGSQETQEALAKGPTGDTCHEEGGRSGQRGGAHAQCCEVSRHPTDVSAKDPAQLQVGSCMTEMDRL